MKFYKCNICGNIVTVIDGDINRVKCCGQPMQELVSRSTDGALEKHVPVYEVVGDEIHVKVGEVLHPMTEEHHISFIAQVYGDTCNMVKLEPTGEPVATFKYVKGCKIYEYCNLHGLFDTTVE